MLIQRVSNAGVLLTLDGVRILLDGLCSQVGSYVATPAELADTLIAEPPDLLAFTHSHADHFDPALVAKFQSKNLRPILGPENLPYGTDHKTMTFGSVTVTPVPSRHIGKVDPGLLHCSFVISGSKCVWFMGDAAPSQWNDREDLPKPDVIIGPYAYCLTKSAWRQTCELTEQMVLVHLPPKEDDPYGLWPAVRAITNAPSPAKLHIPDLGETISL